MYRFPESYPMWSGIDDHKTSVRSQLIVEEKSESSQNWHRVIMCVVTNTIVNSYRKEKLIFSLGCEKPEDKIC